MKNLFVTIEATISIIFLLLLIMTTYVNTCEMLASGQSSGNEPQVWTDRENNMQIHFTYSPRNPVINTTTELKFNVDDLLRGNT